MNKKCLELYMKIENPRSIRLFTCQGAKKSFVEIATSNSLQNLNTGLRINRDDSQNLAIDNPR